jgi:hypothetical protein
MSILANYRCPTNTNRRKGLRNLYMEVLRKTRPSEEGCFQLIQRIVILKRLTLQKRFPQSINSIIEEI